MTTNCDEVRERMDDLLDGRLSAEEQGILRSHLASCTACREVFQETEGLVALVRSVPEAPPPAGFAGRVMEDIAEREALERRRLFRRVAAGSVGSIAAVFLLFLLVQTGVKKEVSVLDRLEVAGAPAARDSENAAASERSLEALKEGDAFDEVGVKSGKKDWARTKEEGGKVIAQERESEAEAAPPALPKSGAESSVLGAVDVPKDKIALQLSDQDLSFFRKVSETPVPPERRYYLAVAEKPEAVGGFLAPLQQDWATVSETPSSTAGLAEKESSEVSAGREVREEGKRDDAAPVPEAPLPSGSRVVRLLVPADQLEGLSKRWQSVPGLRIEEVTVPVLKQNEALRRAGAKERLQQAPAEKPAPAAPGPAKDPFPSVRLEADKKSAVVEVVILLHEPSPRKK